MLNNNSVGKKPEKYTGILLHPTSFPSPYGIGELGASAYKFIDFLVRSGLNTWQVLPLGHTGFGDSPYQPFSAFAGQPLIISIDHLKELRLIYDNDLKDMPAWNPEQVSYGELIEFKTGILMLAYERFRDDNLDDGLTTSKELMDEFNKFCEEAFWLEDYALFMAGKDYHDGIHRDDLIGICGRIILKSLPRSRGKHGLRSLIRRWDTTSSFSSFLIMSGLSLRSMLTTRALR